MTLILRGVLNCSSKYLSNKPYSHYYLSYNNDDDNNNKAIYRCVCTRETIFFTFSNRPMMEIYKLVQSKISALHVISASTFYCRGSRLGRSGGRASVR